MYVKTLTLKGFKSFAHTTTFEFEPGVTAVVGPNGSGKSNIVDALAWVMGEQGAKTLRGGKMEDVIFAGTAQRGPLGRAQVELTIDNTDGTLPIEYTEVTISRTLFRSGGSEYAINGESCRLLDVQELLSDTGLGREMHVIVGQGQLDQVLRATPEERRGFVEEAAGILKHRRRKERTMRKLQAMEANLQRVSDLTGELRRQLKPLGRQAEIARSAQHIQAEARDARSRLLAAELVALDRDLAELAAQRADLEHQQAALQERIDAARARQTELEATTASDELDAARTTVRRLESVAERLRSLDTLVEQRIALLAVVPQTLDIDVAGRSAQADAAEREAAALEARCAEQEGALDRARAETQAAFEAVQAVDVQAAEQRQRAQARERRHTALAGAVEVAEGRVATAERQVQTQREAVAAAADRQRQAVAALPETEQATADPAGAGTGRGPGEPAADASPTAGLDRAHREASDALERAERVVADLRDRLASARSAADAHAARAAALAQALEVRDGTAAIIAEHPEGVLGRAADALQVTGGHEAAVSAALGDLADALLVDTPEHGARAIARARADALGRVTGVIAGTEDADAAASAATEASAAAPEPGITLPAGAVLAADIVTGPPGLVALLARTVIVADADPDAAARTLAALPAGDWRVVTASGDVIGRSAVVGGGDPGASRLQLIARRDEALAAEEDERAGEAGLVAALHDAEARRDVARQTRDEALAALRAADAAAAQEARRLATLRARAEAARAEHARTRSRLDDLERDLAAARDAQTEAQERLETFEAEPAPEERPIDRQPDVDALEAARAAEMGVRIEVETLRERARGERARAAQLREEVARARQQAERQAREQARRRVQLEEAERVRRLVPPVVAHLHGTLDEARLRVAQAEVARSRQHGRLREVRETVTALEHETALLAERAHGLELREHEQRVRRDTAAERVRAELDVALDVLVAEYGPDVPVPVTGDWAEVDEGVETVPFDRDQQRLRLEKAERALRRLGRVNPLALEEYAALEARYTHMNDQLTDLRRTREELIAISDSLDERMSTIFTEAFADTRQAFDRILPVLFPGGRGRLTLTDPEHPLTTGIDLHIRPAGKRIERLSLLSGGERSLAAIALLVAIFIARPSPFYIMDEVEAALDDANLGRLLSVFEMLRKDSQLILITHQKRTMEIADALYGVSMRQDGVSAVVGQRMERDDGRAERNDE